VDDFFLAGVKETSEQAWCCRQIITLPDADRKKVESLGRPAATALRILQHAQTNPILSIPMTARRSAFLSQSRQRQPLAEARVLREITGKQRRRLFVYEPT